MRSVARIAVTTHARLLELARGPWYGFGVLAAFGGFGRDSLLGISRSLDLGANNSWANVPVELGVRENLGTQLQYDLAVTARDSPQLRYFVGGQGAIGAWNIGGQQPPATNWWIADQLVNGREQTHPDVHAFLTPHPDFRVVYCGNDGGIWKLVQQYFNPVPRPVIRPVQWRNLNNVQLNAIQANGASAHNFNNVPVYVEASQDNGLAWHRGDAANTIWISNAQFDGATILFADDGTGYGFGLANPTKVVTSAPKSEAQQWMPFPPNASTNANGMPRGDNSIDDFDISWYFYFPLTPMALSQDGLRLLIGTARVWERANAVWTNLNSNAGPAITPGDYCSAMVYADRPAAAGPPPVAANYNVIYVGSRNGRLTRTTTHGAGGWTQRGGVLFFGARISAIVVDPNTRSDPNRNTLYIALAGELGHGRRVMRSRDGGATWPEDLSARAAPPGVATTPLPDVPVFSLAVDFEDPRYSARGIPPIYAGTELGVYVTVDDGRNWLRHEGNSLPIVAVMSLQVFHCQSQLVAGTYGRGVWVAPLNRAGGIAAVEAQPVRNAAIGKFSSTVGLGSPSVAIDWGDGSGIDTTSGLITTAGTTSTVTGSHTYAAVGVYAVSATVNAGGASVVLSTIAVVADAPIAVTSLNLVGTAFVSLSNVAVATIADADSSSSASGFTAQIAWGDGTLSAATISGTAGLFTVNGTHTYLNAGSFTVSCTVVSVDGSYGLSQATASITGPIIAQPVAVNGQPGVPLVSAVVARFTASSGSPFTAAIDWGDGNISGGAVTPTGSAYTVTGGNTYGKAGAFSITVTVKDSAGAVVGVLTTQAAICATPLTALGLSLAGVVGTPLAGAVLARFTSSNPVSTQTDFIAKIDWGDGTPPDDENDAAPTGLVVAEAGGTFAVTGTHTYLSPGVYPIVITILDPYMESTLANGTATITANPPSVTSVAPLSGPPAGAIVVLIQGSGLFGATAVSFGTVAATSFVVNEDGSIIAVAPAQALGTVDITVMTPAGTSPTSSADQFTYSAGAPTVTAVSPSSGPTGGGTSVTIVGTNLGGTVQVFFGAVAAEQFAAASASSVTAVAPAQDAGTVDITVVSPYGTSAVSASDQFTYNGAAPTVTGIDPTGGPTVGGTLVVILGTNLNGATAVTFGTTSATDFTITDGASAYATSPDLPAGAYDITVTTPYGTSATSPADQYTTVLLPTVSGVSPSSGPTGGGTSVSVSGSGFTNAVQVYFGFSPATTFTINSDTSITATAPAQLAGTVDITVLLVQGSSAISSADDYTYNPTAPIVTAVDPSIGRSCLFCGGGFRAIIEKTRQIL